MKKTQWGNIRIRQDLIDKISKSLETEEAKEDGFSNIAQFTDHVLREAVKELEQKRFSHQNTYDDKVRILDNNIGKMGDIVTIFLKEELKKGFCDYCESENCVHVKYMWELEDVVEILKKRGFQSPYNESIK